LYIIFFEFFPESALETVLKSVFQTQPSMLSSPANTLYENQRGQTQCQQVKL